MKDEFQRLMAEFPDLKAIFVHRLATLRHSGNCRGSCAEDRLREEFLKIGRERFRRDRPGRLI